MAKYLQNEELDQITSLITQKELGICILNGRIESFICAQKKQGGKGFVFPQQLFKSEAQS
jgi:hypothetical protein